MDSREHQDGERKVGVGVAERGRQTVGGNWIWRIGNRWLVLIGINRMYSVQQAMFNNKRLWIKQIKNKAKMMVLLCNCVKHQN